MMPYSAGVRGRGIILNRYGSAITTTIQIKPVSVCWGSNHWLAWSESGRNHLLHALGSTMIHLPAQVIKIDTVNPVSSARKRFDGLLLRR